MAGDTLTIAELEALINQVRAAAPATGSEQTLSQDVALLGALYGRMIFRRADAVPIDALSDRQRAALSRWQSFR